MRKTPTAAFLSSFIIAFAGGAWAQVLGNPVPATAPDRIGVGLGLEQFNRDLQIDGGSSDDLDYARTTFQVNYGVGKGAMVQGYLGLVRAKPDGGDTFSGQEIGANYRQTIDITIPMGDAGIETALLGDLRYGDLDDGESFDYFEITIGYGGSYPLTQRLNAYGGVLYSEIWGEIGSQDVNADDNLGFWGGAEFAAAEALRVSGELHILHEFGIAVLLQYNF